MPAYCRHLLKTAMIMAVLMMCCFISKADPVKDSIVLYIQQNFFDTTGIQYEGISWKWTDTVYTPFNKSPEGAAIINRVERLQSETDSLNAVIAEAERHQQSKNYIDSLSKIVAQFTDKQTAIYDEFESKAGTYKPVLYGYKMKHAFRYKNVNGRMVTMEMIFLFDKTKRIMEATIVY